MKKQELLGNITFGQRVAEDEKDVLSTYFVKTDYWTRLFSGSVDIVYGPKGSGKSALHSLLLLKKQELLERDIFIIAAENPRGATVFQNLVSDPPTTEEEFIGLWKLYFVVLLESILQDNGIKNKYSEKLRQILIGENLLKENQPLVKIFNNVKAYVYNLFRPQSVGAGIGFDPISGTINSLKAEITFKEPNSSSSSVSIDDLLDLANSALEQSGKSSWILLDRLDNAFADEMKLETNALRALFRTYLVMQSFSNMQLKIFLRNDIWDRIIAEGFREASHVTRAITISWNDDSLLNLVVKRILHNKNLCDYYSVNPELSEKPLQQKKEFFYTIFPEKVDTGRNKPKTFDWILSRTKDGKGLNAPRELIHFLNSLREKEVLRLQTGEKEPDDHLLFSRTSFKSALDSVVTR